MRQVNHDIATPLHGTFDPVIEHVLAFVHSRFQLWGQFVHAPRLDAEVISDLSNGRTTRCKKRLRQSFTASGIAPSNPLVGHPMHSSNWSNDVCVDPAVEELPLAREASNGGTSLERPHCY
jgi:hypothetical protein